MKHAEAFLDEKNSTVATVADGLNPPTELRKALLEAGEIGPALLSEPADERSEGVARPSTVARELGRVFPHRPPSTPEETLYEDLVEALGEQTAIITHAMDRWFARLIERPHDLPAAAATVAPSPPAIAEITSAEDNAHPGAATTPVAARPDLAGDMLACFDARDSWHGWGGHQAVALRPAGHVEIRQQNSTPGVVSPTVLLDRSGLFRVTVNARPLDGAEDLPIHARVVDQENTPLGQDFALAAGLTEFLVFAPRRTKLLKLYLLAYPPQIGQRFEVGEVKIEAIDADAYHAWRRSGPGSTIIASLATIPCRQDMLHDCVESLLVQCDRVNVFLNGYDGVPDFLRHPRISIKRSQDWDDRGDAGKFAWIGSPDEPGYRLIADDDLIYPVDFAEKMSAAAARHDDRAIIGAHGILLKQPVTAYYAPESRHVFHFESPLTQDRTVHVLGTNAVCYHSSALRMRESDFMFPNMADIFLARHAQENSIPLISVARPKGWIRQNTSAGAVDTIYEHSLKRTGSRFDTSWIQDAIVKSVQPLTLQATARPKVVLVLVADDRPTFDRQFQSWQGSRSLEIDWSIIAVPRTDDAELMARLAEWKADHELHVVAAPADAPLERLTAALQLAERLGGTAVGFAIGAIDFIGNAWAADAIAVLAEVGAVVLGDDASAMFLCTTAALLAELAPPANGPEDPIVGFARWLAGARDIRPVDALSPEARAACARLVNDVTLAAPGGSTISPMLYEAGRPSFRYDPLRCPALAINGFFEQVFVINLDRRPDRLEKVTKRLRAAGIIATRVAAVDGTTPGVLGEYDTYRQTPIAPLPTQRRIGTSREFYHDHDSQTARVAYVEQKTGSKAIRSPGAWAYLKTWQGILEQVLRDRSQRVLVFDDDVVLHRETATLFPAVISGLPQDWLLLQLGTLQYDWEPEWLTWRSSLLYETHGVAIGSHAVGLQLEIVPYLLDQVRRMLLPFDTGALSAACRAFRGRCFVAAPNIAIQSLEDSDISTSDFQRSKTIAEAAQTYRWHLADYDLAVESKRATDPIGKRPRRRRS